MSDSDGISVVLCVRNAATTVGEQLEGLSRQTFQSWELILVDNGCTDATLEVVDSWLPQLPSVTVVRAHERAGLAYARNVGVAAANRAAIAFCDGDDVVDANWLSALWDALQSADHVGGHLDVTGLNDADTVYWRTGSPTEDGLYRAHGYLPHPIGANFAVWRTVYLDVGGCDEQFVICSDDVDLSWRIQRAGGSLGYTPDAIVQYRLRSSLRQAARQQWTYGRAEARLFKKYRTEMRRPALSQALQEWIRVLPRIDRFFRGRRLRGAWVCFIAYRAGRIRGGLEHHVAWW
ncbi:MAG TPA: glycosyltransferase [Mycobacteriales bacterium]|nr:glycosyltransferase [Mycobacteriales bacterium]